MTIHTVKREKTNLKEYLSVNFIGILLPVQLYLHPNIHPVPSITSLTDSLWRELHEHPFDDLLVVALSSCSFLEIRASGS